jgi:hypothetical protein
MIPFIVFGVIVFLLVVYWPIVACLFTDHRRSISWIGTIRVLEKQETSFKGIQKGILKCQRCGEETQVFRTGNVGFGGPLSLCDSSGWHDMSVEKNAEIESLPGIKLEGATMELVDFFEFSKLYESFKRSLVESTKIRLQATLGEAGVPQTAQAEAAKFRAASFDAVLASLKEGLDKFKKRLTEKMIHAAARQNPYSAWNGDRIYTFPPGCRFWFRGNKSVVVVLEEPPQFRTIRVNTSCGYKKDSYYLHFPHMVFILVFHFIGFKENKELWHLHQLRVAGSKKPLLDPLQTLYEVPLPDLNGYRVCMGKGFVNPVGCIATQCAEIIDYFWHSMFKKEWVDNINRVELTNQRGKFWPLENWEANSAADKTFCLNPDWVPNRNLFEELFI